MHIFQHHIEHGNIFYLYYLSNLHQTFINIVNKRIIIEINLQPRSTSFENFSEFSFSKIQ